MILYYNKKNDIGGIKNEMEKNIKKIKRIRKFEDWKRKNYNKKEE